MTRFTAPTPTRGSAPSHSPPDLHFAPGIGLARSLGWFSIGLGLAELLMPRKIADLSGVGHPELVRFYGLREIACGIGILSTGRPAGWLAARVAGDAVDLATVGAAMTSACSERRHRAVLASAALAGVTALDVMCAAQLEAAASLEG